MLGNNRCVQNRLLLEDAFEKVGFAPGRTDVQGSPADESDAHTPPPDFALQSLHQVPMAFVEPVRQAKQGGQLPDITPTVGVQVPEVLVVVLGERSAMIASHQADDHAFLGPKREPGGSDDDLPRRLVMILRVLGFAHVMEQRRGTQPDPFGIAHVVQRLQLVKKTQGQPRNLKGVILLEAIRFADRDDGVDDPSASHVASFSVQPFSTGWYSSLRVSEEQAKRLYSYRLFFPCHRSFRTASRNHYLLPPTPLFIVYNAAQQRLYLNLYTIAVCVKLDMC
jgi:hypothetical protein